MLIRNPPCKKSKGEVPKLEHMQTTNGTEPGDGKIKRPLWHVAPVDLPSLGIY